jgi:hypothetical protein
LNGCVRIDVQNLKETSVSLILVREIGMGVEVGVVRRVKSEWDEEGEEWEGWG